MVLDPYHLQYVWGITLRDSGFTRFIFIRLTENYWYDLEEKEVIDKIDDRVFNREGFIDFRTYPSSIGDDNGRVVISRGNQTATLYTYDRKLFGMLPSSIEFMFPRILTAHTYRSIKYTFEKIELLFPFVEGSGETLHTLCLNWIGFWSDVLVKLKEETDGVSEATMGSTGEETARS